MSTVSSTGSAAAVQAMQQMQTLSTPAQDAKRDMDQGIGVNTQSNELAKTGNLGTKLNAWA